MNITPVGVAVALAVVVALAFLFFGPSILTPFGLMSATGTNTGAAATATTTALSEGQGSATTTPSGLLIQDLQVGTGTEAMAGDSVTVEYVGQLTDGTVFDSTQSHGQPFTFTLGAGQVIAGWDEGVAGMKVGGERALSIPPSLGYGAQQVGPIPPNSTLIFEIKLDSVQKAQ